MSLHLVFSWFADGAAWPEHPGEKVAVVDAAVVGPHGLLDHIETMLGLGAPAVAGVKRIATYLNKLKCAGAGNFWSKSFETDPWSTAREVLAWRDQLVEAGWGPEIAVTTGRLGDLARAETSGPALPAGFADRLRQVIEALATPRKLPLACVVLIDARADLPAGWRRLLDRLEACGVSVTAQKLDCVRHESGDLARLLAPFDADGQRREFSGDGGVTLLTADTEVVAAEALAAWLAADKAGNEDLVFILGKDSDLLDHALRRAGLPRLGASATSAHRALLQVLPLAFSLAWNPPDPQALLDFLLLPAGPLQAQERREERRAQEGRLAAHRGVVGGSQQASGMSRASFAGLVSAELNRHKFYPAAARSSGVTGSVAVAFTMGPSGRIVSQSVTRSSGSGVLDGAAHAIMSSIHTPPPPGGRFSTSTVIQFHLN